jgi:hypothetical protein
MYNVKLWGLQQNASVIIYLSIIKQLMAKSNVDKQAVSAQIFITYRSMVLRISSVLVNIHTNNTIQINEIAKHVLVKISHLIGHAHVV